MVMKLHNRNFANFTGTLDETTERLHMCSFTSDKASYVINREKNMLFVVLGYLGRVTRALPSRNFP